MAAEHLHVPPPGVSPVPIHNEANMSRYWTSRQDRKDKELKASSYELIEPDEECEEREHIQLSGRAS